MSSIEPSDPLTKALRLFTDDPRPAVQLPEVDLDQLRQLQWVTGSKVVESNGIGRYHAGPIEGGLLGGGQLCEPGIPRSTQQQSSFQ